MKRQSRLCNCTNSLRRNKRIGSPFTDPLICLQPGFVNHSESLIPASFPRSSSFPEVESSRTVLREPRIIRQCTDTNAGNHRCTISRGRSSARYLLATEAPAYVTSDVTFKCPACEYCSHVRRVQARAQEARRQRRLYTMEASIKAKPRILVSSSFTDLADLSITCPIRVTGLPVVPEELRD